MKNIVATILFLCLTCVSTPSYSQGQVPGGSISNPALAIPPIKAYTIEYTDYNEFKSHLASVTSQFGSPYKETTPNVPNTEADIATHLVYADTAEVFPSITGDCSDRHSFYVVLWKREDSNKAYAKVDIMFSLKGFDGTGVDLGNGCPGKGGNWLQAFKIPSNTNLPQFLLDKL